VLIAGWQRVTHRLLSAVDDELAGLDLSAAETNVLACLAGGERPSVREVGAATAQRPSTLTGVLDRLERRKLVARRPNPADRRSTLVVPTAAGRAAAREVAAAFERVAARIPPSTAADVERVLGALDDAFADGAANRTSRGASPHGRTPGSRV
jgi:DNA-binding MarR family transcriptional regulator